MKKRENIYIVPTEYGFMYGAGIFVSLIAGAVYNNNLCYILCFFLVALFLIGMVQTHANLRRLNLEKLDLFLSPSEGTGHGVIWLKSLNEDGHSQIRIQGKCGTDKIDVNIPVIYRKSLHPHYFDFETGEWGKKTIKKIKISTRFPFGFFHVWRNFEVNLEYFIYPSPSGERDLPLIDDEGVHQGFFRWYNGDDFSEHKNYEYGDSQKHIDWKAYARGRPLMTKKFDEGEKEVFSIDYDQAAGDKERRLRQMAQWIHQCEREQSSYSLKIFDVSLPPAVGEKHRERCLKILASQREVQ